MNLINIDQKSAYPYITKFKKESFKSFAIVKRKEIGRFYVRDYKKLIAFYNYFNENLLNDSKLTLENLFWFTLLGKYLKEERKKNRDKIFSFIKRCEIRTNEQLGFSLSLDQHKHPDIYSTYFALVSIKNIGLLNEYFASEGQSHIKEEIKNFILSLKKGNTFLHCHDNECKICKSKSPSKALFYIMEIFTLLGVDVRNSRDQFRSFMSETKKKGNVLIYKFLCLKYIELDSEAKEKEIQSLLQYQKESGGYGFNQTENLEDTFWIVYILSLYSWLLDFNPSGVYSFINNKLNEILSYKENWDVLHLVTTSKLIILLSLIWKKFISEIERVAFKELEKEKFVDLNQLKTTFGLSSDIEDLISYINLNYSFKIRILDNKIEFKNYIRNLSKGRQEFIQKFYDQITTKSIISLSEMFKNYKTLNLEPLKLKEDIIPIVNDLITRNFLKGDVRAKKPFLAKTKYNFYLNYNLEEIIVSDTDINTERILEEREKLEDIRNDIYNVTFKLENIGEQIREEINSYLLINEIDYAKERLKFIIRSTVMEADFLNENIENSFNEDLYFTNLQAVLSTEITQWNKIYSVLQNNLAEVDSYLKGKINEKELLRNLDKLLEKLMERLGLIEEDLSRKLESFKKIFSENLEREFTENKLVLIIQHLNQIIEDINRYDKTIYNISHQITTKEVDIVDKHRKIIENWVGIKEKYENEYKFYEEGFQFFKENLNIIKEVNYKLNSEISKIGDLTKSKISANQFQEAFEIIKNESDIVLNEKITEIRNLQSVVKDKISKKQKLYLLYKHLQDDLDNLESKIIDSIAEQSQFLKDKVTEERDKTEVHDLDNFVSQEITNLKSAIVKTKNRFDEIKYLQIGEINKEFDLLQSNFNKANKLFVKKYNSCVKNIEDFEVKSKLTILQWENFTNFFTSEVNELKDEFINDLISNRINIMAIEKKTNNIKLVDLKDELNLSCKVLIKRLKDMIDISKISADMSENNKFLLVHTEYYYLNKDLRNYLDNHLLKSNRERVGKILSLYDSSIRNLTLSTNMLELQNRIKDLKVFEEIIPKKFYDKINELQIKQERQEFLNTKEYFESIIENERKAINSIELALDLFNSMQNFIDQQYNIIKIELKEYYNRFLKESEKYDSYLENQEIFVNKKQEFKERTQSIQEQVENELRKISYKSDDSNKLIPEMRETFVKKKNEFLEEFDNKTEKINERIEIMKNETFRTNLMDFINNNKIKLSQLLGNLERKVEDNIEIKEFKKINVLIQKRGKSIEIEIKEINRAANAMRREYNRQSKNFQQISKFVLEDFDKFLVEFTEILNEKVKSLERLILKAYINMTIKAVANEFLTVSFLNNELKIKKQNIQDHLLFLISSGELKGKYDPRFFMYFENPDVLNELDETELEVIKSTNYKLQMFRHNLRNFAVQYGSIIAFFSSIVAISYYLFLFSGNNPVALVLPIIFTLLILSYYFVRKREEKIS
ncbi:MAG: prenyltransferase/squalene oxidase repeat-containing protein [Promethearchaeota archaeon]